MLKVEGPIKKDETSRSKAGGHKFVTRRHSERRGWYNKQHEKKRGEKKNTNGLKLGSDAERTSGKEDGVGECVQIIQ